MTAFRVKAPDDGPHFKDRGPKKQRAVVGSKREGMSKGYLDKIRLLPCCTCRKPGPSQASHLKCAGGRGMGMRAPDKFAVPQCVDCHLFGLELVGSKNEFEWFMERGIQPIELVTALWHNRSNIADMHRALVRHWATGGKVDGQRQS